MRHSDSHTTRITLYVHCLLVYVRLVLFLTWKLSVICSENLPVREYCETFSQISSLVIVRLDITSIKISTQLLRYPWEIYTISKWTMR